MIPESEKFVIEACRKVVHNPMQVAGGIGCTNVLPLERIYRDLRLASIWTGTSEVMSMIIGRERYREHLLNRANQVRDFEADAAEAGAADGIIYE